MRTDKYVKLIVFVFFAALSMPVGAKTTPEKLYAELEDGFNRIYVTDQSDISDIAKKRKKLLEKAAKTSGRITQRHLADICWNKIAAHLDSSDFLLMNRDIAMFRFFFPDDSRNDKLLDMQAQYFIEKSSRSGLEAMAGSLAGSKDSLAQAGRIEELLTVAREMPAVEPNSAYAGVWVSDSLDKKTGLPLYMIRIHQNGNVEILEQSAALRGDLKETVRSERPLQHIINNNRKMHNPEEASILFSVGSRLDNDSTFNATFLSIDTHQGSKGVSDALMSVSKNAMATSGRYLSSSGTGLLLGGLGGTLFSGLLMYAAIESSKSTRRDVMLDLSFNLKTPETAVASLKVKEQKASSDNAGVGYVPMFEKTMDFYRISPYDRVTLYDASGCPFSPYEASLLGEEIIFDPNVDPWHSKGFTAAQIVYTATIGWYLWPSLFGISAYNKGKKKAKGSKLNKDTFKTIVRNANVRAEEFRLMNSENQTTSAE